MSARLARCAHSWKSALRTRIIRYWVCRGMTIWAQACEAKAKLIRSSWRSSSDAMPSKISSGRRRSGGRALVVNCLVLSEKAGKGQPEKRNGPQSELACVLTLCNLLLFSACVRNIATTSVDQLTTGVSGRKIIYSYSKIRTEICDVNSTYHESTNTRAVRPFSSTENFHHATRPPVSLATQILHCPKIPSPDKRNYHASASQSTLDRQHNPNA